jgi:hypothetical protein
MLSVIYAECHIQAIYAECHYAECRYAECRGTVYLSKRLTLLNVLFLLLKSNKTTLTTKYQWFCNQLTNDGSFSFLTFSN